MSTLSIHDPTRVPRHRRFPGRRAARVRPYVSRLMRERAVEQQDFLARVLAGLQQSASAVGAAAGIARTCHSCGGLGVVGGAS
ncbi:hypothetical protein J4H86_10240 [Spiractinospora alimapuensis]|uniref:hypothetical protein n=1 Tax=Spiractinospora alimapuensis TaxID=2820884 RepID=UPI001F1DEF97|nr:hypothetical protein [Spiractinospora alimapuensis]QVQ54040.1 hypothetical protein J4H86_10240 [Spiractinospora alimapuensis]